VGAAPRPIGAARRAGGKGHGVFAVGQVVVRGVPGCRPLDARRGAGVWSCEPGLSRRDHIDARGWRRGGWRLPRRHAWRQ